MELRWVRGGLVVASGSDVLLVDAPPGVAEAVGPDLGRVRAVVVTTGRARSVAGLLELLTALEPHRPEDAALPLILPLGEERAAAIAEVWASQWDRYPLTIDAQLPGFAMRLGPFGITSARIRVGEPRWHPARVEERVGMALRIDAEGESAAIVLGAAPSRSLARWCDGADLAVIEVGVAPWPATEEAWRLRTDEALALASAAAEVWLVGDDGLRLDVPES